MGAAAATPNVLSVVQSLLSRSDTDDQLLVSNIVAGFHQAKLRFFMESGRLVVRKVEDMASLGREA